MANPVFFIPRPAETDGEVNRSVHETYSTTYRNYRTADGELLKWSASFPLPTMGQRIRVTMNGIGDAEVVGFFKEEGYVGVMTKALDPPTWLKEQLSRNASSPATPHSLSGVKTASVVNSGPKLRNF